jgi:S-adenosylmethionine:tRNA ribosyltransferase-isomerase
MDTEWYQVDPEAAAAINERRRSGGRIIAVGTSTVRTLETVAQGDGRIRPGEGWSSLFIYPGHRFRAVDALVTNFHLPKTTLLMLVSALAGREAILRAYGEAIREGYRFYSFGDAMLIL